MSCRKIKRLIPLFAGGDLKENQAEAVRAHLAACTACRAAAAEMASVLRVTKTFGRDGEPADWTDAEWRAIVRAATSAEAAPQPALRPFPLRPVLAGTLALALVAAGAWLALKKPGGAPSLRSAAELARPWPTAIPPGPERPPSATIRIVTKDGKIQVIWPIESPFSPDKFGK